MQKISFSEKGNNIIKKNKARLEKALNINIELSDKTVTIESNKEDSVTEYTALSVLEAVVLGFDIDNALMLRNTDFILKKIDLKSHVKDSRINVVKSRIIGTQGTTKHLIEKLSECSVVVSDHIVVIIGRFENIDIASQAIQALIRGSPQSKVYSFLERSRSRLKELSGEDIEEMVEK